MYPMSSQWKPMVVLFSHLLYKRWKRDNPIQDELFGILAIFFPRICVISCCGMALGTTTTSMQFMCCFSPLVCARNYPALQVRNQNKLHISDFILVLNVLKNSCFSVQRIIRRPWREGKLLNAYNKWFSLSGYF